MIGEFSLLEDAQGIVVLTRKISKSDNSTNNESFSDNFEPE